MSELVCVVFASALCINNFTLNLSIETKNNNKKNYEKEITPKNMPRSHVHKHKLYCVVYTVFA